MNIASTIASWRVARFKPSGKHMVKQTGCMPDNIVPVLQPRNEATIILGGHRTSWPAPGEYSREATRNVGTAGQDL